MATKIAIDTLGASSNLQSLNNAIKATTNAWKSQEIALKSSGDMLGAAQTRYNGLSETIDRQKAKLSELVDRQNQLINVNQETVRAYNEYENKVSSLKNELQNLDTTTDSGRERAEQLKNQISQLGDEFQKSSGITKKDAEAYLKLEKNISSTEKQLSSYEAQQKRAANTLKYYQSGLADLQQGYKLTEAASKAYVNRLQTEGRESEANKAKIAGLKQSLTNLNSQYNIQTKELKAIASEEGLTSSAYVKQKTRVDQTAASIAKLKDQLLIEQNNLTNVRKATDLATTASKSYVNSLTALGRNTEAQRVKLTNSINVHNKLATQLNAEQKYLSQLGETYGRTSTKYQEQAIKVNDLTSKYQANVLETRQLNRSVGEMSSRNIRLKDSFSIVGNAAHDGFSKVRTGATYAAGGIAAFGVAAMSGAKRATSLQHTYQVNTNLLITGGEKASAAIKNVSQMQRDGEKYSLQYGKSQQAIAEQYQELIKRGYSSKQALGAMRSELQASVASGDDFNDVVKVSSQVVDAFGMRTTSTSKMVHNTRRVVNELAYSADMTATDFQSLGIGMSYVGDSAKTAGFSLAETSAAMGELSNHGLEADKAGTGLRKTIVSLAKPSKDATEALKSIGIESTSVFKDANGNFKSLSDILGTINAHTKNLGTAQQAAVFKAIFGTTGMQSAQILAQNNTELTTLTRKVQEAGDKGNYVSQLAQKNAQTAQMSQQRFKQAWADLTIMFGSKMLPYMTEAANSLSKLFAQEGFRKDVKAAAGDIGQVAGGILNIAKFSIQHADAVKTFAKIVATIWVIDKVRKFARATQNVFDLLKIGRSNITRETEQVQIETQAYKQLAAAKAEAGKAGNTATEVKSSATSGIGNTNVALNGLEKSAKNSSKWNLLGKSVGTRIINGAGIAITAWDVGSSIAKAVKSGKAKDAYTASGKTAGTLIGGGIGTILAGPGFGTVWGAQLGEQLGGSKTVTNIAKKFVSTWKQVMSKQKLNPPKLSNKKAYDTLNKETAAYYKKKQKQDKKDLDLLHKNGMISDAEYAKRLQAIKVNGKKMNQYEKLSQKDRTAVSKYYAQQRQQVESKYASKKRSIISKWDKKIYQDQKNFGNNSLKVQQDYKKRDEALRKNASNKRKAISDLNLKYAKKNMTAEAKLHTTLSGKIQLESNKQAKILQKLSNKKSALSKKDIKTAENELQKIKKLANEEYNAKVKAADKAENKLVKAAQRQRDEIVKAADDQRKQTIDAAKRQFQGNDQYSKQQRKNVIDNANQQYAGVVNNANNQYTDTVNKASAQHDQVVDKAKKQKTETVKHAEEQHNQVVDHAKKQGHSAAKASVDQANDTMTANSKQGSGVQSIWNKIADWFNQLLKFFHVKELAKNKQSYDFSKASILYSNANGGSISQDGLSLVGEAGPELRYKPYAKTVDIVGTKGAEIVKLSAGEQILNAQDTAKLFTGQFRKTLPGYAQGTLSLDDFLSKAKDAASDIWDSVSDEASDFLDKITDPKKTLEDIVAKTFNLTSLPVGTVPQDISKGMVDSTIKAVVDEVNKLKKIVADFGSASNPGGSGVQRWIPVIRKAAAKMKVHLTEGALQTILHRIAQESNGNPTITNNWDSNAAAGHPSKGLLQYIQPTLNAWVPRGVKPDLGSGYVQLLAMFNDSNWLSDISVHGGWGPTGYKRFANGGRVDTEALYHLAEGNQAEYVIPMAPNKRPRAMQLLKEVVDHFAAEDSAPEDKIITKSNDDEFLKNQLQVLLDINNNLLKVLTTIVDIKNSKGGSEINLNKLSDSLNSLGLKQRRSTSFQS